MYSGRRARHAHHTHPNGCDSYRSPSLGGPAVARADTGMAPTLTRTSTVAIISSTSQNVISALFAATTRAATEQGAPGTSPLVTSAAARAAESAAPSARCEILSAAAKGIIAPEVIMRATQSAIASKDAPPRSLSNGTTFNRTKRQPRAVTPIPPMRNSMRKRSEQQTGPQQLQGL